MTSTDRIMGGLSCWMKENPTHGSVSVMYEVTTAGGTGMGTKCIVQWSVIKSFIMQVRNLIEEHSGEGASL